MDEVVTDSKVKGVAVIQFADDNAINNELKLSFTKKILSSDNVLFTQHISKDFLNR